MQPIHNIKIFEVKKVSCIVIVKQLFAILAFVTVACSCSPKKKIKSKVETYLELLSEQHYKDAYDHLSNKGEIDFDQYVKFHRTYGIPGDAEELIVYNRSYRVRNIKRYQKDYVVHVGIDYDSDIFLEEKVFNIRVSKDNFRWHLIEDQKKQLKTDSLMRLAFDEMLVDSIFSAYKLISKLLDVDSTHENGRFYKKRLTRNIKEYRQAQNDFVDYFDSLQIEYVSSEFYDYGDYMDTGVQEVFRLSLTNNGSKVIREMSYSILFYNFDGKLVHKKDIEWGESIGIGGSNEFNNIDPGQSRSFMYQYTTFNIQKDARKEIDTKRTQVEINFFEF
jgi:hypothetical protein